MGNSHAGILGLEGETSGVDPMLDSTGVQRAGVARRTPRDVQVPSANKARCFELRDAVVPIAGEFVSRYVSSTPNHGAHAFVPVVVTPAPSPEESQRARRSIRCRSVHGPEGERLMLTPLSS